MKKEFVLSYFGYIDKIAKKLICRGIKKDDSEPFTCTVASEIHLNIKERNRKFRQLCLDRNDRKSTSGIKCSRCDIYLSISPCFYDSLVDVSGESSDCQIKASLYLKLIFALLTSTSYVINDV